MPPRRPCQARRIGPAYAYRWNETAVHVPSWHGASALLLDALLEQATRRGRVSLAAGTIDEGRRRRSIDWRDASPQPRCVRVGRDEDVAGKLFERRVAPPEIGDRVGISGAPREEEVVRRNGGLTVGVNE